MSSDELERLLGQIRDREVAAVVRRFLMNLFRLFNDDPPPHIQGYIAEILGLLGCESCPVKIAA